MSTMDEHLDEVDLPRGVALAWGVAANPQRGPKRELSIERIVEVAIDLADADGLGSVSMAAVAQGLGFTPMSLYRYVTAKDDLVLLMFETAMGIPSQAVAEAPDWRSGLVALAGDMSAAYRAHPWLIDVPILGIPNTPNNLTWMDAGLAALRDTPLTQAERIATVLMVTGHARWRGIVDRSYAERTAATGVTTAEFEAQQAYILGTLVNHDMFPHLREAIDAGVFTNDDDPFGFALARMLDGLDRYMTARGNAEPVVASEPSGPTDVPRDPAVRAARQVRRELEGRLREAQRKEREALAKARERADKRSKRDER